MDNYEQRLYQLLEMVVQQNASDLHLSAGRVPTLRVDGGLIQLTKQAVLSPDDTKGIVGVILSEDQLQHLHKNKSVDLSYAYKDAARFRVNIFYQFGTLSVAMRFIPDKIKTIEELNLPPIIHNFTKYQQGFVLITGPAGHGKSTTLAAMIEEINKTRSEHIITIEDPIEYVFSQNRSIVDQREVGRDALNFHSALRAAFRQDPDIIMVGELRDSETISTAISAAETGHLILGTLHTNNAAQTIDRIIDSFPPEQQSQVRSQLALTIAGVISQRLVPRVDGGRVPATEIMLANTAVRNLIREHKVHEIGLVIDTSADEGMISLNRSLADLVKRGEVSVDVARNYSLNSGELKTLIGG